MSSCTWGSMKVNNQILLNVLSAGAISAGRQPNTLTMDNGIIHIDGGTSDARQLVNNGIVLDRNSARVTNASRSGANFTVVVAVGE